MPVKLEVIAKPRSLVASGSTMAWAFASVRARRFSAPCALQVTTRCAQRFTYACTISTAAALSGLFPERAKETSSVGMSADKPAARAGDEIGGGDGLDAPAQRRRQRRCQALPDVGRRCPPR